MARRFGLGHVQRIRAEAFGLPGQRTFRLSVESGPCQAYLWVEREQLEALSLAINELLGLVRSGVGRSGGNPPEEGVYQIEFKVGQLAIGYDERRDLFVIAADAAEDEEGLQVEAVSLLVDREQLEGLDREIQEILASGRPRCPLCHLPINLGETHVCPRSNGHLGNLLE
jgi:uncharacterized repeat protein (TIGR03847 family)